MSDNANNQIVSDGAAATLSNSNTISGAGTIGDGDKTLTLDNQSGGVISATGINPLVVDTGNQVTNNGTLEAQDGSVLNVADAVAGTGSAVIQDGRLAVGSAFFEAVSFTAGDTGALQIGETSLFGSTIFSFAVGDIIDLQNVSYDPAGTAGIEPNSNNVLAVVENGVTYKLQLDPSQDYSGDEFVLFNDKAYGGTDIAVLPSDGFLWIDTAGGNWSTGADWSSGAVPGAANSAFISLAGATPYSVAVSKAESVGALTLNATNATLQVSSGGSLDIAGALTIDNETAGVGGLTISDGGVVSSASGEVGTGGLAATVSIDGAGSQWTMTGQLVIGQRGAATGPTVTISNNAKLITSTAVAVSDQAIADELAAGSLTLESGGEFEAVSLVTDNGTNLSLSSGAELLLQGVDPVDVDQQGNEFELVRQRHRHARRCRAVLGGGRDRHRRQFPQRAVEPGGRCGHGVGGIADHQPGHPSCLESEHHRLADAHRRRHDLERRGDGRRACRFRQQLYRRLRPGDVADRGRRDDERGRQRLRRLGHRQHWNGNRRRRQFDVDHCQHADGRPFGNRQFDDQRRRRGVVGERRSGHRRPCGDGEHRRRRLAMDDDGAVDDRCGQRRGRPDRHHFERRQPDDQHQRRRGRPDDRRRTRVGIGDGDDRRRVRGRVLGHRRRHDILA